MPSPKIAAAKVLHQICQHIWKTQQWPQTGKGQFSLRSQTKAMPKDAQTTAQLYSSHMLAKWCSKSSKPRLQHYVNRELPDVQDGFRKGRGTEIKLPTSVGSLKKRESSRKTFISALLTMPKPLTVWITINCGKFWKRWEYQTTWPALEKPNAGQEATVRTGHGTTDWFQIGKKVRQGCILSPCLFNLYAEYIMGNAGLE